MSNNNQKNDIKMKEIYKKIEREEKEIRDHNNLILSSLGEIGNDFNDLMDSCTLSGKIEIVDIPQGQKQCEDCGIFKDIHVDQNGGGYTGDDFSGEIYTQVPSGKWLKIPYYC